MAEITAPPLQIGRLLTAHGTITADAKTLESTVTWNSAGVTFTAWKLNVTDTASAAASLLADLQTGGASQFKVSKAGVCTASTSFVATTLTGTLSTAAQPNVTSVGTLTSLTVSGTITQTAGGQGSGIGTSVTTGNVHTNFIIRSGTNAGANNNNADVWFSRGASTLWQCGVLGTEATDGALRFYDTTAAATKWTLAPSTGNVTMTGALSGVTTLNMSGNLTLSGYGTGGGLVSVGAADSGGAGFKLLRVPN